MEIVTYDGSLETMQGVEMSEAFNSTLHLSLDVRGGLLMRQIHHWAALLFTASLMIHMLRVFFTGAFRKPRDVNWLVGFGLLTLSLLAGFSGYSLPDDVLSGNGLRILDGVVKSIPVLGKPDLVLDVRRGVPRRGAHPAPLHAPRAAHPRRDPGAHRPAPLPRVPPQAHPVPGRGPHPQERRGPPPLPRVRREGRRLLLRRVRRPRPARGDAHHQPDLELRAVRSVARLGGRAAGLVHALPRGRPAPDPRVPRLLDRRLQRADERPLRRADPSWADHHLPGALPLHRGVGDGRQGRAPRAGPPAQRPRPHGHRRRDHRVLRRPDPGRLERHPRDHVPPLDQRPHQPLPRADLRASRREPSG